MSLTKEKYNKQNKTFFEENADKQDLVEKLGRIEIMLNKYNIEGKTLEETYRNLERFIAVGEAGILRIERAINNKIYIITARKTKKAFLIGFSDNGNVDDVIIERKGEQTTISYREIYISRKEARREKRGLQVYHLDKKHYDYFFPNQKYNKHTFLIEVKKGTDVFKVYTKVLKTYWRNRTEATYSIEELKEKYYFDINVDFKKEKEKFLSKRKKYEKLS